MFHVPERARERAHPLLATDVSSGNNGAFHLESPEPGWRLFVIASDGSGWEHVSVHAYRARQDDVLGLMGRRGAPVLRTPRWSEMVFVKDTFWDAEDVVIQYHPRASEYVNLHPHVLHLWRPIGIDLPTPPMELVG